VEENAQQERQQQERQQDQEEVFFDNQGAGEEVNMVEEPHDPFHLFVF
jgi:hypothetical protein